MPVLAERVADLEHLMAELIRAQIRTEESVRALAEEMRTLAGEMRALKADMLAFKDEMRAFKDEMLAFKDEMRAFKDEMQAFKDEMLAFKDEMLEYRKESNRQWGNLANRLGSIAEDVVAPNVRRLATTEWGFTEVTDFIPGMERRSRRGPARTREFDVVCAGPGKVVVCEVRTTPRAEHAEKFAASLAEFFDFFPEYEGSTLIGAFGSWALDDRLRATISACGLYGLAMGEETMEVVARPAGAP